jgi:Zn finger protein HypA/HybF involved in hydrogenase expression
MVLQTEREFTLPKGYLDEEGNLHREGVMRLATAADEIVPLKEAAVQKNPAYLTVILLSRVVTRLGSVSLVTPNTIEKLFATDVAYLQDVYNEMNHGEAAPVSVACPQCHHEFEAGAMPSGRS